MFTILTHLAALLIGIGAGGWAHYKWGSKLAAIEAAAKAAVQKIG